MKEIIFSDSYKKIVDIIDKKEVKCCKLLFVKLTEDRNRLIKYFNSKAIDFEVVRGKEFIKDYHKDFSVFMAELNVKYHSKDWWAMHFTSKNPITSSLCETAYHAVLIDKLLNTFTDELLIIISDNKYLLDQIKIFCREYDDVKINFNSIKSSFKDICLNLLPVSICYRFIVTLAQKIILLFDERKIKKEKKQLTVVMSLLYEASFNNERYEDPYFGKFVEYLKNSKISFLNFMELCSGFFNMRGKTRKYARDYNIFHKEKFISFSNIIMVFVKSFFKYYNHLKIKNPPLLYDKDISLLLNKYIRYEFITSRYFRSFITYYSTAGLCRKCDIQRFYYPFENRSFEKMLILAVRKYSKETEILAYQHASISLRHTNFLLTHHEVNITPLPDKIITMGEITRNILKEVGNFPEEKLKTGCALRQKVYNGPAVNLYDNKTQHLLVVLATGLDEYAKVIDFLNQGIKEDDNIKIWIRPHPVFRLEDAFSISCPPKFRYYKTKNETIDECFNWAEMVLYVHSTVAIEALMRGIPIINLAVDNIINADPLFGFNDFKWTAYKPQDIKTILGEIYSMADSVYKEKQKQAQIYSKKYIEEIDVNKLNAFLA
ncbi:hypothetical protein ACFL4O_01335 [bacterium]